MNDSPSNRLYPLQDPEGLSFYAGTTRVGKQVLMGMFLHDMIAIFFDEAGVSLGIERRPMKSFDDSRDMPASIYDLREHNLPTFLEWQEEIGFVSAQICVRKFHFPHQGLGIRDLPSHFEQFLANPDAVADNPDEKDEYQELIHQWRERRQFVLCWGNDLWIDGDGEVEST